MATEIIGRLTGWQTVTGTIDIKTIRGYSAYDVAVQYGGFVGTEEEWLASLKGNQGDQGIQGPIGPTGPTGERGNGISNIAMDSGGYITITTTDGTDYRFYIKGDKGDPGEVQGLAIVATTGDYDDLVNKPDLPDEEDFVEVLNLMTDYGYASPYSDIDGNVITEGDDYIVLG